MASKYAAAHVLPKGSGDARPTALQSIKDASRSKATLPPSAFPRFSSSMASKYAAVHVLPEGPGDARPTTLQIIKDASRSKATFPPSAFRRFSSIMASKYAEVHVSPKGPGDARPTALQIIKDEGLEGKLKDKTFLITGCSSGIGIETARAIAATGATVYCTARDLEKGKTALADILEPGRVELIYMDLNSLASVRTAAAEFLSKTSNKPISVLICNAGVMAIPAPGTTTEDGFETHFGTNHLAHFLLFNLLKPSLLASSTPQFNSRVVTVSSTEHRRGGIHIDDYNFKTESNPYDPWVAYAQSKTANVYMASYIARHYGPQGIHATSAHPGNIKTSLGKYVPKDFIKAWALGPGNLDILKSPEQGAATTVWAAVSKEWEGKGGKYLENVQVSPPLKEKYQDKDPGHAKHVYDEEKEERLWADSLKMVGLE